MDAPGLTSPKSVVSRCVALLLLLLVILVLQIGICGLLVLFSFCCIANKSLSRPMEIPVAGAALLENLDTKLLEYPRKYHHMKILTHL